MAALVIHAPYWKGKPGAPNSWETYFETGVGRGYAIPKADVSKLGPGSEVVLLRNDYKQRRAQGLLTNLICTGTIPQGMKKYDVYFGNQKQVPYCYKLPQEKLSRQGVAVY